MCLNLCQVKPSSFLTVVMSPKANPFDLLIPTSTGSSPVLSATSSTWSNQGNVATLPFLSNYWLDPSAPWVNGCTEILAVKCSNAFILIEEESLLVFDKA